MADSSNTRLDAVRALVDEQVLDEGLWFVAETASEAYLQQELRRLHDAVERGDDGAGPLRNEETDMSDRRVKGELFDLARCYEQENGLAALSVVDFLDALTADGWVIYRKRKETAD